MSNKKRQTCVFTAKISYMSPYCPEAGWILSPSPSDTSGRKLTLTSVRTGSRKTQIIYTYILYMGVYIYAYNVTQKHQASEDRVKVLNPP